MNNTMKTGSVVLLGAILPFIVRAPLAAQYETYIWQTPQTVNISTEAQPLIDKLRAEIDKILAAGHLAPLRYNSTDIKLTGLYFYQEPGRIINTLAYAYPYLTQTQQAVVRTYVRAELNTPDYRPWSSAQFMHPTQGARREFYRMVGMRPTREWDPDSGIWTTTGAWQWDYWWAMDGSKRPTFYCLYGLWLYAYLSGDWAVVTDNWTAIKNYYNARKSQANIYGTMGSCIAMARMAYKSSDTAMMNTAIADCNTALALTFSQVDANREAYFTPVGYNYGGNGRGSFHHGWMFLNMVPEVARCIDEGTQRSAVITRNNEGKNRYPVWWSYRAPYFTVWCGEEGVGLPPEIIGMIMPVERWIVKAPAQTLAGYQMANAMCGIGDCYVLEGLVFTISAFGTTQWVDVRTSSGPSGPFAPMVILTNPVNGSTFTAPATIALAATASDIDGTITRVEFWTGTTMLTADTSSPYAHSWTGVAAGTYSVRAVAYDNDAMTSTSTAVTVYVHPYVSPNQPPTVSLTSPMTGSSYTAPADIALTATAADPDGTIASVRFYRGSTLLNADTASPYEYTWTNVSSGTYQLRAVAQDNQGATSTSTVVTVTVLSSSTPAVWYTLTATANPANGGTVTPASGTYLAGSQIQVTATPNANYTFATWSGDASGTNPTVTLTMDSDKSITANFTYVPPVNQPPVVNITAPSPGARYSAPASIAVSATASDSDGSIVSVGFYYTTTMGSNPGVVFLGSATAAPYQYTWANVGAGEYGIIARAKDDLDAVTSASVYVIVDPAAQPPQPELKVGEVRIVGEIDGYMNPAMNPAVIRFRPTGAGLATVKVYTLRGALVWEHTIDVAADADARIQWFGRSSGGADLPSGVYILRLTAPGIDKRLKLAIRR
jgi:hypothetical protein